MKMITIMMKITLMMMMVHQLKLPMQSFNFF